MDSSSVVRSASRSVGGKGGKILLTLHGGARRLLVLTENAMFEDEDVHVGGDKATVGVLRRGDNWFSPYIEAGVDDERATCLPVEFADQAIKTAMTLFIDGLDPRRPVDMGDRRNRGARDIQS